MQAGIRALVVSCGEVGASKALGVDRLTVARALASLPMMARTIEHLERRLANQPPPADQLALPFAGSEAA